MRHPTVPITILLEELLLITLSILLGYNCLVQQAAQSTKSRLSSIYALDNLEIRLHDTSQHSSPLQSRSTDENIRTQIMSFCCVPLFLGTHMYLENPNHCKILNYNLWPHICAEFCWTYYWVCQCVVGKGRGAGPGGEPGGDRDKEGYKGVTFRKCLDMLWMQEYLILYSQKVSCFFRH